MFQKVLLVVVTLFLPERLGPLEKGGQVVWAAVVIVVYLGVLATIRPYNDPLDDCMDLLAEAGNATSILVALSIVYHAPWLSPTQANVLLFVANGVILVSFFLAFIISPARTFWRRRQKRAQLKQEQAAEEGKFAEIMDGVNAIKVRRASQAQLALVKEDG